MKIALDFKPLDDEAKKAKEVYLFCLSEYPQIVSARWTDNNFWSGWEFTDELLRDVAPEGPQGSTHYAIASIEHD